MKSPVAEETKKSVVEAQNIGHKFKETAISTISSQVAHRVPEQMKDVISLVAGWWKRDRISKQVEASLPFRELDVLVIDGMVLNFHHVFEILI